MVSEKLPKALGISTLVPRGRGGCADLDWEHLPAGGPGSALLVDPYEPAVQASIFAAETFLRYEGGVSPMPRPRVPDHIKLLQGQKVKPAPALKDESAPVPPDTIGEQARELWDYYLPKLDGVATVLDRDLLADYCEVEARLRVLRARLASGAVPVDQEWRLDAQIRSYVTSARQLARELGLTPKAREGMRTPPNAHVPPENPIGPERLLS